MSTMTVPTRRGFTLVEMLMSLSISTVVLGAIGSLFVLMGKALPDDSSPASRSNQLARAIDRFSHDISWATEVVSGAPARVELVVPDCTGDSLPDTVVYTWAGAGSPWIRTLNVETPETIVPALQTFTTTWRFRQVAGTPVVKTLESVRLNMAVSNSRALAVSATICASSHARMP